MDQRSNDINELVTGSVTRVAGNIWFAYCLVSAAVMWMSYNVYIASHGGTPPDEPWDFSVMLLCSNFIQLLIPVFILVSQRRAEARDRLRADRDQLLTLVGRRDVLLMFTYLSEFVAQQRGISLQHRESQEKLFALERDQHRMSEDLLPDLVNLIGVLSETIRERPCLVDSKDTEAVDNIIARMRGKHGSDTDDLGEGQGHLLVDGVAEPQ
jgi:uncharacterized membrane protein